VQTQTKESFTDEEFEEIANDEPHEGMNSIKTTAINADG
jgi:hypothetical protein